MSEQHKLLIDGVSMGGVAASLIGWLPAIAAIFSIVWTSIRIYETKTVQRWLNRKKEE